MNLLDSLAELNGDDFKQSTSYVSGKSIQINIDDIAPDPDQPRKQFDDDLIDTIARQFVDPDVGQIEAIFVRTNSAGKPPYLIVHGETRYLAAKRAGLPTIRAVITEYSGYVRQLLSNETRGDLALLDKARAYQQLIDQHGYTQKSVAELLGKDSAHVSMHIALLDMPPLVKQTFDDGKATTVRVLTDLKNLVGAHKSARAKTTIENFISNTETITRRQIAELSKKLGTRKSKKEAKSTPMIEGKTFKVIDVEQLGDESVICVKRAGEKEARRYRLVPCE